MRVRPSTQRRGGAAAAELFMVLAVLIPVFILALDAARVYQAYIVLTDCARNGAVYLSDPVAQVQSPYYTGSADDYKTAALANKDSLGLTGDNISGDPGKDTDSPRYASVTISYDFAFVTTWEGLPTKFTITRTVQVRVAPVLPDF